MPGSIPFLSEVGLVVEGADQEPPAIIQPAKEVGVSEVPDHAPILAPEHPARRDERAGPAERYEGETDDLPGRGPFPPIHLDEVGDVVAS